MSLKNFVVFAGGSKGADFVKKLFAKGYKASLVYSYKQPGIDTEVFDGLVAFCHQHDIELRIEKKPALITLPQCDAAFSIGWQFMLPTSIPNLIVFHDSLLPKFRGFAPTVTALIAGETELGVTAILPNERVDAGDIVAQAKCSVNHPMRIADAFDAISDLYISCAEVVLDKLDIEDDIVGVSQNESLATYSAWRDEFDMFVDWNMDAAYIQRFIYALGHPYTGAKTRVDGTLIKIGECEVLQDLNFVDRAPGKLWSISGDAAIVVCGTGLVKISQCCHIESGLPYSFNKLRTRLTDS